MSPAGPARMRPSGKCVVALCAVAALLAMAPTATEPVAIVVEHGYFKSEPAYVRLKVRVEPDAANRLLRVTIDAPDSYRRAGDETLPGARAPRTRWVEFKEVPAGVYTVTADVERGPESPWHDRTTFEVRGRP